MSRILNGPRRGRRSTAVGLTALSLGLLAVVGLAPQANAAFTSPQCEGADVLGRGASFPQAAHGAWEVNFHNVFCGGTSPDISYEPTGSGSGIAGMALRGPTDPRFGGTDDPLTSAQKATINAGTAATTDDGQIHQIPAAVGAVAPLVNFPDGCDVNDLPVGAKTTEQNLDADGTPDDVIRVLFTKVQYEAAWAQGAGGVPFVTWRELFPTLADNAGCNKPIIRVVRFDNSGTTFAFKDYLSRIAGGRGWLTTYQTGTNGNREWPGATFGARTDCAGANGPGGGAGEADATDHLTSGCANGASNVVSKVIATDGSIGYADIASARTGNPSLAITPEANDNDTYWTQLRNGSDVFQEPTIDANGFRTDGGRGANCTQTQFSGIPATTLGDWSAATGVDSTTGYGLCTLTYGMLFDDNAATYGVSALEEARARTVKDYYSSIVSDTGQALLFANDYTPLPAGILALSRAGVTAIDWNKGAGGGNNNPPGGGGNNNPPGGGGNVTPPPPAKPSNQFSVPKTAISSKTGSATVSVKLPGAGKLVLAGTAKSGKKTIKVGGVTLTANKAGTFKLTLKPGKAAKALLKKKGSLKVSLKLTFTPKGGTAKSSTRSVTLKLIKPKKKSGRR